MNPIEHLLRDAGAEIERSAATVDARWRGLVLRVAADADVARVRTLLQTVATLGDPLPSAEIALTRHDAAGTRPVFVPMLAFEPACALWELGGDSTFLYFDRERAAMTILGRDADGAVVRIEHALPRVHVGDHSGRVGRDAGALTHAAPLDHAARAAKQRRLREHLRCVRCSARAPLQDEAGALRCESCAARYPVIDGVPILLQDPAASGAPGDGDASSNTYSRQALALIDRFRSGLVLDCGCGRPAQNLAHVVSVEIVRYQNVDVVASADALPFAPATFDAVICEAVLEHVPDPWRVVAEIDRVLRDGAAVLFDVPFIAPFHGYPNHFHNFTQAGLQRALACFEEISCGIQPHQEPWVAFGWILRLLREGLADDAARARFDATTFGAALHAVQAATPPDVITRVDDATRRALAAGFTFYGRKPAPRARDTR